MSYSALVEQLRAEIEASPFEAHADSIIGSIAPAVAISTTRAHEKDIPLGESKFGGRPHVPERFEWPHRNGQPLMFLAQIDLDAVPREHLDTDPLPSTGMLYFFYDVLANASGHDVEDQGAFKVVHLDAGSTKLKRMKPPKLRGGAGDDFAAEQWAHNEPCTVKLRPSVSLAPQAVFALEESIAEEQVEAMYALHEALFHRAHGLHGTGVHRLLGHPDQIQDLPWSDCQLNFMKLYPGVVRAEGPGDKSKALRHGERDWRLLLQIDSDDAPGWMWSDVGSLYFCIREQDLRAWNLDRVWGVFQCS